MLLKISRYIISVCLLVMAVSTYGQGVKVQLDTTTSWEQFIPTGIRVGTDLITIVKNFTKSDYQEYNFQADIDFYRYFLNVEFGQTNRTLTSNDAVYNVKGSYLSVGPDVNFLHRDPDRSALFFGLRYGLTKFSDELNYTYDNIVFGSGSSTAANNNLNAHWYEMVAGMKVPILKMVWLGYTARFKFGMDTFEQNTLIPNYIPGYGKADERATWGFNYYLIFRIPVRKAPTQITVGSSD